MAAIQNHKDNLLQAATVRFDATLTEVDWVDVVNNYSLKPEDLATFGAEFDVNIIGTANTHNITENAVSEHDFADDSVYTSGETIALSTTVIPKKGSVLLFFSVGFRSSHSSTSGYSEAVVNVTHETVAVFNQTVIKVPNESGAQPFEQRVSGMVLHQPAATTAEKWLADHAGNLIVTHAGQNIVVKEAGEIEELYDISATFNATGDGTRGAITYFSIYALVLKR